MNRRSFIHTSAVAGLATWTQLRAETPSRPRASVHVFSKHLQFLDYEAMAARAAELGFDGVDLTIRPGGHVDPAHADRDLPRAAAALRAAGLDPLMCTTALTAMDQPHADALLDAIADAGFTQLRLGWHRFPRGVPLAQAIDEVRPVARKLAEALQRRGRKVTVASTVTTQPPMIADELRRQADYFIELSKLQNEIGRDPAERPVHTHSHNDDHDDDDFE